MYIFVRQDLSLAQQLVQASHAAHESGLAHQNTVSPSSIIIFGTQDKCELEYHFARFSEQLKCFPFFEPYKNIGLTAFATEPIGEDARKLFKEFKLWSSGKGGN